MSERELDLNKYISSLPENLFEFVNPDNPVEKRLMAAEGAIPLIPGDLTQVLFCLIHDSDEIIREAAKTSMADIPEQTMLNILSDTATSPELLDYISREQDNEDYFQAILLNSTTTDSTYAYLAQNERSQVNLEIIAQNKQRIMRSLNIVECLSQNPSISRSTMDSVLSFISLYLEKDEKIKKFLEKDDKETEIVEESVGQQEPEEKIKGEEVDEFEDIEESFLDELEIPEELLTEYEDDEVTDHIRESITSKIRTLTIAEKIKLAIQGNMEIRRILVRDNNRLISSAVLKNPRLSDMEVILISQSKMIDEEILRQISETRKWTRHYQVKSSLVNNPKTPLHISLNFLRHLRHVELRQIMSDRNLPGVINQAARKILKEKR